VKEIWLAVEIHLKRNAPKVIDEMILNFVKPTIESLERERLIETFHFFNEGKYFLLRVRTLTERKRQEVCSIVNANLTSISETCNTAPPKEDYTGEQNEYGTEGWLYVQKFFEYASRISLLKKETIYGKKSENTCNLEGDFNDLKLVHCFLNAQGLFPEDEVRFHKKYLGIDL